MPINGMEVGSDLQLVIVDTVQGLLTCNILNETAIKQITKAIENTGIDGQTLYAELPKGWSIDVNFTQADTNLLDYVVANEATYFAGGQVGTITMTATITDASGGKNYYRFTGGALKLTDAGMFKGLEKVSQRATVMFSRIYKQ